MSVLSQVQSSLSGLTGWKTELALTLAEAMDEEPNASTARELRILMADIAENDTKPATSVIDDLRQARLRRIGNA